MYNTAQFRVEVMAFITYQAVFRSDGMGVALRALQTVRIGKRAFVTARQLSHPATALEIVCRYESDKDQGVCQHRRATTSDD